MSEFQPTRKIIDKDTSILGASGNARSMPKRVTQALDLQPPTSLKFTLSDRSTTFEVPMGRYLVVGRKVPRQSDQVDINLTPYGAENFGVSRYHAIIQLERSRISIKDMKSTNGTFLNGFVLKPMHSYRLRHGDELAFGRLNMHIYFVGVPVPDS